MRRTVVAIATAALLVVAGAGAASKEDHALLALNILPPGEGANLPDLTSQIAMYDGLTPLQGNVTAKNLTQYYKRETLGLGGAKATRVERPKSGLTIYRDSFDVPHVYGTTRANTEFGAGWVTAGTVASISSCCAAPRVSRRSTCRATTPSPSPFPRARSLRARRPRHSSRLRRSSQPRRNRGGS